MFRCEKRVTFEAAHELPYHSGKCRKLHGHSMVATIICEGEELAGIGSSQGMLIDFGDIKDVVNPIVDQYLDHCYLNETLAPFGILNPTSEEIAKWLYHQIRPMIPQLVEVRVAETCTSSASYRPSINNQQRSV